MQLTHLSLTDFRNFARLDIEVPGGATLFVGANAQGKTSLLEAIYYLAVFSSFQASNDRQLVNFHADREPVAVARIRAQIEPKSKIEAHSQIETHSQRETHSQHETQSQTAERSASVSPGAGDSLSKEASVEYKTSGSGTHSLEIRLILQPNNYNHSPRVRKEILIDGVKRRVGDAIGIFNAVLFLPQMLRVVEGPPDERRRYLNMAMVQVLPNYAHTLSAYNRALSQRNALLRQLAERGGDIAQLDYWDEKLAAAGAKLIQARIQTIQSLEELATEIQNELTRDREVLRLLYQPAFEPLPSKPGQYELPMDTNLDRSGLSVEQIQNGFIDRLQQLRNEEIGRGMTTIGPHRDELRLMSNGIDLGYYGSRGQARTAILALKLAEVAWMRERSGQWPVLLLDEVLAELDPLRRQDLLRRLSESEQVMLTTTDLDLFTGEFLDSASIWQIQGGQVLDQIT